MRYSPVLITAALLSMSSMVTMQEPVKVSRCEREESGAKSLRLSLTGWRNSTGDWVTDVAARKEMTNSSRNTNVEVEHKIFECNGKTVVHLRGREEFGDYGSREEELLFNDRHGKNAVIVNSGRSAFRLNPDTINVHGILFTSRPLKDDELFEIRLENKISKWGGHSIGIGVTALPISSFTFPGFMMEVKSKTWMMYNRDIYVDGTKKKSDYGKNLITLEVSDKVGVKRTSNGELHVYVNGADQGVAATEIPLDIHGVVDIINNFISVAIV